MNKLPSKILWLAAFCALTITGCDKLNSPKAPEPQNTAPQGTTEDAKHQPTLDKEALLAKRQRLTRSLLGEVQFNPWFINNSQQEALARDLFEGLTSYDRQGNLIAGLASHWQTKDNKKWRVDLRDNLHWSDGSPLTAADIVANFQGLSASKSPLKNYLSYLNLGNAPEVLAGQKPPEALKIRALDEKTLEFTLDKPTPYFPEMLAHVALLQYQQKNGEWLGTGAYRLKAENAAGVYLSKNPYYYAPDAVSFEEVAYLPQEQADIVFEPKTLEANQYFPKACGYFYEFNLRDPQLKNAAVRKAIASLISVRAVTDNEMPHAIPSSYFLPKAMLNGQDSQWEPVVAEQLLSQQQIDENHPLHLQLAYDESPLHGKIANRLARTLAQSDLLRISEQMLPWQALQEKRNHGKFQLIRSGWCADFYHPMAFLSLFYSQSPDNKSGYVNKTYDALFEKALKSTDAAERAALYWQMSAQIQAENLALPLFQYTTGVYLAPDLRGVEMPQQDKVYSKDLWRAAEVE